MKKIMFMALIALSAILSFATTTNNVDWASYPTLSTSLNSQQSALLLERFSEVFDCNVVDDVYNDSREVDLADWKIGTGKSVWVFLGARSHRIMLRHYLCTNYLKFDVEGRLEVTGVLAKAPRFSPFIFDFCKELRALWAQENGMTFEVAEAEYRKYLVERSRARSEELMKRSKIATDEVVKVGLEAVRAAERLEEMKNQYEEMNNKYEELKKQYEELNKHEEFKKKHEELGKKLDVIRDLLLRLKKSLNIPETGTGRNAANG